jgi:hypothetical protein
LSPEEFAAALVKLNFVGVQREVRLCVFVRGFWLFEVTIGLQKKHAGANLSTFSGRVLVLC